MHNSGVNLHLLLVSDIEDMARTAQWGTEEGWDKLMPISGKVPVVGDCLRIQGRYSQYYPKIMEAE
jgi:hypothetical protein